MKKSWHAFGLVVLLIGIAMVVAELVRRFLFNKDNEDVLPPPRPMDDKEGEPKDVPVGVEDEAPPPPPVHHLNVPTDYSFSFAPGQDTSDSEQLWELLHNEGFRQRGEGFHKDWAFHLYATQNDLGLPLGPTASKEQRVKIDGKEYGYQVFARDTLYNEIPKWSEIQSLNNLLASGTMPESGLGYELLKASYASVGSELHPDWISHRTALEKKLGPALSDAYRITVDGKEYSLQVFAFDTLYVEVPNWKDIQFISEITPGNLCEALLAETYKACGATYDPSSPFHQTAAQNKLGTPLSDVYEVDLSGNTFKVQVYATGVVYATGDGPVMVHKDLMQPALPEVELVGEPATVSEPGDAMSSKRPTFTLLPIAGKPRLSQLFGYTKFSAGQGRNFYRFCQGRHPGIDFAVPVGTPLVSIGHGVVVWSGTNSPFASGPRSIVVRYGSIYAIYGHVSSEQVQRGQIVRPGEQIGLSGTLGGPHLHFELREVPERALNNTDPMQAPVNPGFTSNPVLYFSKELQTYFEKWYHELGGDSHYCVGSYLNQDKITFGGPMDTRPCTNP
jgi:murein DD-endopeptidase MepM/ murein hydrolase activator NlpD